MSPLSDGDIVSMTVQEFRGVEKAMGFGAMLLDSAPDYARGKQVISINEQRWAFWLKSGKRVSISVARDGGLIISVGRNPDPNRPAMTREVE